MPHQVLRMHRGTQVPHVDQKYPVEILQQFQPPYAGCASLFQRSVDLASELRLEGFHEFFRRLG